MSLNAQAPESIPRATNSSGGRRGKHISSSNEQSQGVSSNNSKNNNNPGQSPSMFNQVIVPQNQSSNTSHLQPIQSLNSPREAALKNKYAAQGSLGLSLHR
jgi:hypothetical protein